VTTLDADTAFELVDRLGHAYALFDEATYDLASAVGLSSAELVAMVVLASMGSALSQSEWGRLQGVTRQRAHVVANALVQKGLVARTRVGRESQIALTVEGKRESRRLRANMGRAAQRRLGAMPTKQATQLHALLGALVETLEATRELDPG